MIDRVDDLCLRATRHLRRLYRYLTGDPSCLGFVKVCLLATAIFDVTCGIAYFREGSLADASGGLVGGVIIVLLGGAYFHEAAATDRSPIGPSTAASWSLMPGMQAAITVFTIGSHVWQLTHYLSAGAVLGATAGIAFIHGLWAAGDRDGGDGERTLSRDLRRLFARPPTPETARVVS